MKQFIISNEASIRLGFFIGIFVIMCVWEILAPKRKLTVSKTRRWLSNGSIVIANTLVLRFVFPILSVGVAFFCVDYGYGLFNLISFPNWLAVIVCIVFLDMLIYWQHVIFHKVPLFWRIHRMHHADMDIDVTTGSRFHPIEIVLSMLIKFLAIIILGIPVLAIIIFEVILNLTAMFNHSNVRIPFGLDAIIRKFIVTPDMHRVHHSVIPKETNSNYGFNLSIWDRLFGTYIEQPKEGHLDMQIGLNAYRDVRASQDLDQMLLIPFKK